MFVIIKCKILKYLPWGVLFLLIPVLGFSQPMSNNKPNIILIMADDLGYECLGCYGSQSYKTPNLDQLAQTGLRFDHCYSQPLCTPSRVKLMTGRYNFRNYIMFGYFDIGEVTFAHVLKNAGYSTCIAGKWQLSNGIEGPYNAGFDEYALWQIYRKIGGEMVLGSRYADPKIYQNGKLLENTKGKYGPDVFCDFIMDFIERKKSTPFLVYYPMVLTHNPFVTTPDNPDWEAKKSERDNKYFADMVNYMDKTIGRIVKKLEDLHLRENTLILFIGDNGTHQNIRSKMGDKWIQGGKSLMTDAGTHVPFIANWKGTIMPERVCEDLIDFSDFMPTLAEVANAPLPEDITIDGRSFYPQILGKKGEPKEWIFMYYWERGRNPLKTRRFTRDKRWKLYDDKCFFDVLTDPLEQNPIKMETMDQELVSVKKRLQDALDNIK